MNNMRNKLKWLIGSAFLTVIILVIWPNYADPRVLSEKKAIINNLRFIAFHSHIHMLENGTTSVNFETLRTLDPAVEKTIRTYLGESYETLTISSTDTQASIETEDGTVISIEIDTLDAFRHQNENPNQTLSNVAIAPSLMLDDIPRSELNISTTDYTDKHRSRNLNLCPSVV